MFPAINPNQPAQPPAQQMPESSQNQIQQPATVQITPPAPPGHIATTKYSPMTCYICGYPNHPASHCALNNNRGRRGGGRFPFRRNPKNWTSHNFQKSPIFLLFLIIIMILTI